MKKIISFYTILLILISASLIYEGCSKLNDNVTTPVNFLGPHPAGWLDTTSGDFHGAFIRNAGWKLDGCKICHGYDYRGGSTNTSCYKCHTQANGPEACNTCHGDPADPNSIYPPKTLSGSYDPNDPHVGAHFHHLNPDYASTDQEKYRPVACMECHRPVNKFSDTNHINPVRNGSAGLTFGPLAKDSTGWGMQNPNPTFDPVTYLCSNVYCHGDFKNGNTNFQPQFNNPNSVKCGSCHGDSASGNPTPGAPNNYHYPHLATYWSDTLKLCNECHTQVIDAQGNIINPSLHIDGILEVHTPANIVSIIEQRMKQSHYVRKSKR